MSEKDNMIAHKFVICVLLLRFEITSASWPIGLQSLALAQAPSSVWPGMRVLPAAPLAQASLIQPLALREMQLAYPVQAINIGQYSPLGVDLASEQEILQFQRNQQRRLNRLNRERQRIREREQRNRNRNFRPFGLPTIRHERNKTSDLFDSGEVPDMLVKNRDSSGDSNKQQPERIRASSDDDFVLMQKLNNDHIKTTIKPPYEDGSINPNSKPSLSGQIDMMPPDPPTKPVDIRRKTMASPNGQVTYITEMLYDVGDGNGHSMKVTRPPMSPSFIPAPNDGLSYSPTDDPRTAHHPFITIMPPSSNGVLTRPSDSPATEWPIIPTPPTPFRAQPRPTDRNEQTEGSERRESNSFPSHRMSDSNFHIQNRHLQTERPPSGFRSSYHGPQPSSKQLFDQLSKASSTSKEKTWKGSGEGLGAAAIAGIVIGSLVSLTLLAGTALFVMYKSPFGKRTEAISERRSQIPVQNVSRAYIGSDGSCDRQPEPDSKVYRWPPRRSHQQQQQTTKHHQHQHRAHRPTGHQNGSAC